MQSQSSAEGTSGIAGATRPIGVLLVLVALVVIVLGIVFPPSKPSLLIVMEAPEAGSMQVYFDMGKGFKEELSSRAAYAAGQNRLVLPIPFGEIEKIRFDPSPGTPSMRLYETAIVSVRAASRVDVPLNAIGPASEAQIVPSDVGVLFDLDDSAKDPQLVVTLPQKVEIVDQDAPLNRLKGLLIVLAAGLFLLLIRRSSNQVPTPLWLLAPLVLILAMASVTTTVRSVHPDEYSHVSASRYYLTNWLPPAADDPRILDSYTPYGTSYLNELDVVYFFAAKVSAAWAQLVRDETQALRAFNAALFAFLIVFAWLRRSSWAGAAVLLVSPQIWYLFSYFNADAFPLFLSFMLVFLYAAPESAVSDFVERGRGVGKARMISVALFVLVLGLLLVSKRNYLPVVLVTGLLLAARHLRVPMWSLLSACVAAAFFVFRFAANLNIEGLPPQIMRVLLPAGLALLLLSGYGLWRRVWRDPSLRPKCARLFALFLIAAAIAFPRFAWDGVVNGDAAQKQRTLHALAEKYAIPGLKPSAISKAPEASLPGHNLAEKGVGYFDLFGEPYDWAGISWESAFGVYGYMEIRALPFLYVVMNLGIALCALRVGWEAKRDAEFRPYLLVVVCGIALTALSSTVFSWVVDLQPQGRYLMPCFAIAAAALMINRSLARSRAMWVGCALCMLAALCSFIAYAMPNLVVK